MSLGSDYDTFDMRQADEIAYVGKPSTSEPSQHSCLPNDRNAKLDGLAPSVRELN